MCIYVTSLVLRTYTHTHTHTILIHVVHGYCVILTFILAQLLLSPCLCVVLQEKKRRQSSLLAKKQRRRRYREKKKVIHRLGKEKWESIAQQRLQQRWTNRSHVVHIAQLADLEEERKEAERQQACELEHRCTVEIQEATRNEIVDAVADQYIQHCAERNSEATEPLLLDAVLLPVKQPKSTCQADNLICSAHCAERVQVATNEKNQALRLARHYRNLAESARREKRELKHKLENEVELVRDFWRNQIVEGGSRSGKILRAALLQ